jgi:hypothetical protein
LLVVLAALPRTDGLASAPRSRQRRDVDQYRREFIEFLVRAGVLTFGNFDTKSGGARRTSSTPDASARAISWRVAAIQRLEARLLRG